MKKTFASLHGLKVMSGGGRVIGTIADLELDPELWTITGLVVKLEKHAASELGLRRRLGSSAVVIRVEHVKAISDLVLLKEDLHSLAHALETGQPATAH